MSDDGFVLVHEEKKPENKPRLPRFNTRFFALGIVCTIFLFALFFMFSSYFHVRTVLIEGNIRVGREEIFERLEVDENTHMMLFNTRNARRRIMENMYIEDVVFERNFPGQMNVTVVERRLTAYIEHMPGSFLYLDDNGRVLEIRTFFTEPLPVLHGLEFTRFQLGEILEVPDVTAFNVIVQYAQLLNHHNLIERVSHINVSDTSNIRIYIDNIEFNVGGGVSGADMKIRTIAATLEAIPNVGLIPGFMDLRELRKEYRLILLQ